MRDVVQKLLSSLLGAEGRSDPELRRAAIDYGANAAGSTRAVGELPAALDPYLDKLMHSPYKIVDRDLTDLQAAGFSEDDIFEVTVAASVGTAHGRLERLEQLIAENPA